MIQQQQLVEQIAAQRRAQREQKRQFNANQAQENARLSATVEANKSSSALNLAKWQAEQAWKQGEPSRTMALEAYRAKIKPKSIDEKIFDMLSGGGQEQGPNPIVKENGVFTNVGTGKKSASTGGLTVDELKQRLHLLVAPKEEKPAGFEPYSHTGGKTTYRKSGTGAGVETPSLQFQKQKYEEQKGQKQKDAEEKKLTARAKQLEPAFGGEQSFKKHFSVKEAQKLKGYIDEYNSIANKLGTSGLEFYEAGGWGPKPNYFMLRVKPSNRFQIEEE
jgi:type II secretory pathway pseudopilin PulG